MAASDGPGRGSTFTVVLPILRETVDGGAAAAPGGSGTRLVPGHRILVADDNRPAAESLAELLALDGHEVRTAFAGAEAVAAAAAFRPEAVLLDLAMPGISGYEAAARIRGEPWGRDILLVAVSGWGREADRARGQAAGFDAHLTKPLDYAALSALLKARFAGGL